MSSMLGTEGSRSRSLNHLQNVIILFSKSAADGSSLQKVIAKDTYYISYTVRYVVGGKAQSLFSSMRQVGLWAGYLTQS